jgi:nitroreductase
VKNDSPQWETFVNLLSEFNRSWASAASALVIVLSKKTFTPPGKDQPITIGSHAFDTGAAWGNFALQVQLLGWAAHGIGGFDKNLTREKLAIPEEFSIEAVIAVGKRSDDISKLPESLQAKEVPSLRNPVSEFISEATFSF